MGLFASAGCRRLRFSYGRVDAAFFDFCHFASADSWLNFDEICKFAFCEDWVKSPANRRQFCDDSNLRVVAADSRYLATSAESGVKFTATLKAF